MKTLSPKLLCLALLLCGPVAAVQASSTPMRPTDRASLSALHSPRLESMRAGAPAASATLDVSARAALRQAESRSTNLTTMRAGLMTDRDWTIVIVAVAVVIIILAIA